MNNRILSFLLLFILANPFFQQDKVYAWGWETHRYINENAVDYLPPEMDFFEDYRDYLRAHSIDPDVDGLPGYYHYIDIDYYPEFFEGTFPHDWDEAVDLYGYNVLIDNGTVPWVIELWTDSLTVLMSTEQWETVWQVAAELGHYVADSHQPLHLTLNYNGQLTGNYGIHSRYETHMINPHLSELPLPDTTSAHWSSVIDSVFRYIDEIYPFVSDIMAADDLASAQDPDYNSAYYNILWDELDSLTMSVIHCAIIDLASIWQTAWDNANSPANNTAFPVSIDGLFDDWSSVPVAYSDGLEDGGDENFEYLKIANDDDFLFLYLEFQFDEILMQDWNDIHLYIDADADAETGHPVHGIGAELDWCFGCRDGAFYIMDGITEVYQNDLTLRIAPTITGKRFEIAISRNSSVLTMDGTQEATTIRIAFKGSGENPDILPDEPGGVLYEFDPAPVPPPDPISLEKDDQEHVRILTYNVWNNGLFDNERQPRFERIIKALEPDIMGFQEADGDYDIEGLFEDWLPGVTWYVSDEWNGNYLVSRYPILYQCNHSWKSMGFLLDTEEDLGTPLFLINSHFSCCGANEDRQQQVDELMSVLRNLKEGLGPFTLPVGTPIVHVGDFNLVGYRQQLETLTDGDIVDEASYGIDFSPDWDDSPMTDLFSRHTHIRMGYTWRSDGSSFNPGKLDYILYTDSVIEPEKHFVLNTTAIPEADLFQYGLYEEDTNIASDHLPRILDIAETMTESSIPVPNLEDWNLVGLPLNVEDPYYLSVFPDATEGTFYSFSWNYIPNSNFIPGEGYWLHFDDGGETVISGTIIDAITISLVQGWNLISGISTPVDINTILDEDNLIVSGTVYGFEELYISAEIIEPGYGYWLRSVGEGEITLSASARISKPRTFQQLENTNTITLNNFTLYFGADVEEKDRLSYSLPPKPPSTATDIRFSGGTKLCTEDECVIELMNNSHPLTIEFDIKDGEEWELVSIIASGTEWSEAVFLYGQDQITVDLNAEQFILRKSTTSQIPSEFALSPAYPNPFNPVTRITYQMPEDSYVSVAIFNLTGQKIADLIQGQKTIGFHSVYWNGKNNYGKTVISGLYFYQMKTENFSKTLKLMYIK